VVDELHAHKTRDLYDVLDTATGARSQPLISDDHHGRQRPQRHLLRAARLHDQGAEGTVVDETWFGVIFTIDEGDDWHDPKVWRKANPNLGISVKLDDLEAACRKAQATPSAQANFLTKRLNVWVNADSGLDGHGGVGPLRRQARSRSTGAHLPCWVAARPGQQGRRRGEGEALPRRGGRPLLPDPTASGCPSARSSRAATASTTAGAAAATCR
jgi:hypothetical protein